MAKRVWVEGLNARQARKMFADNAMPSMFSAHLGTFNREPRKNTRHSVYLYPLKDGGFGWIVFRDRRDSIISGILCGGRSTAITEEDAARRAVDLLGTYRPKPRKRAKQPS